MEGQATWMMSEYLARKSGQSLKDSPALLAMMSGTKRDAEAASSRSSTTRRSTCGLRWSFPTPRACSSRMRSTSATGKRASPRSFCKPPVSTQQILHPEKYFSASSPPSRRCPRPTAARLQRPGGRVARANWSTAFCWSSTPARTAAAELAPHWRGCNFRPAGEQEGRPPGAALRRGVGQRRRRARSISPPTARCSPRSGRHMSVATQAADAVTGTGTTAASSCAAKAP